MVTVYLNDDCYIELDQVKTLIPFAWQMPGVYGYIDTEGRVIDVLPTGKWHVKSLYKTLITRGVKIYG